MPAITEFDLTDPTARLVAADALQEQGEDIAAAALRQLAVTLRPSHADAEAVASADRLRCVQARRILAEVAKARHTASRAKSDGAERVAERYTKKADELCAWLAEIATETAASFWLQTSHIDFSKPDANLHAAIKIQRRLANPQRTNDAGQN